jgi:hypothetical protein
MCLNYFLNEASFYIFCYLLEFNIIFWVFFKKNLQHLATRNPTNTSSSSTSKILQEKKTINDESMRGFFFLWLSQQITMCQSLYLYSQIKPSIDPKLLNIIFIMYHTTLDLKLKTLV